MAKCSQPGRTCPLDYYYAASTLAHLPEQQAKVLYIIGGLYGNPFALNKILQMAQEEQEPVTLAFNGDFNWFNYDKHSFHSVNQTVLMHDASLGNVEAELLASNHVAGCGCAYPESVDENTVERSNQIHAILKKTAHQHPEILQRLSSLPMARRYIIGNKRIVVVHGDSSSLAGWQFGESALRSQKNDNWLFSQFKNAQADIFASTHTCLPALKTLFSGQQHYCIINNGAAGMPNFRQTQYGVISRLSTYVSPHLSLYGHKAGDVYIDALAVKFDQQAWVAAFLKNWPCHSAAHESYHKRIINGPDYSISDAMIQSFSS